VVNVGTPVVFKVPNLLAIPNCLDDVLRNQGTAAMPADVLTAVDSIIASADTSDGAQWDLVRNWCMVAGQAGNNNKSHVFLDIDSVTINNEEWVRKKLDSNLGPRPTTASATQVGTTNNSQTTDYIHLSQILATTVGSSMLKFTQAVLLSASTGTATPLETGKGFDKDQIAKLKDACRVSDTRAIPNIWFVIQSSKGKSYDSYRAHLAKSTNAWCRANHIERDKSIYLPTKFFEYLVALRFNPGGPVAQYSSVAKGMSMLACRSVTAVEAKYQQGYEEAMDQTK
jgi:hypothetical protein